jgi:hypothetical protein
MTTSHFSLNLFSFITLCFSLFLSLIFTQAVQKLKEEESDIQAKQETIDNSIKNLFAK